MIIGSDDHKLYAFNTSNGDVRWTRVTGDWLRSGPAVLGGSVFVGKKSAGPIPPMSCHDGWYWSKPLSRWPVSAPRAPKEPRAVFTAIVLVLTSVTWPG